MVIKTDGVKAIAYGTHVSVAAADTISTGLRKVVGALAVLSSDPTADPAYATATIPNQISDPGEITLSTWMPTAQANTIPIAATTFSKNILWIAFGE